MAEQEIAIIEKVVKLDQLNDVRKSADMSGDAKDFMLLEEARQYLNMWHRHVTVPADADNFSISVRKCADCDEYGIVFASANEDLLNELTSNLPTKWDIDALRALELDVDQDGII